MKNHATKERRRDREEFVNMYANKIGELRKEYPYKDNVRMFVEGTVKKSLPYSCKTRWADIFCSLSKTYSKLFKV